MRNPNETYEQYQARMKRAFEAVEPEGDWKAPINKTITAEAAILAGGIVVIEEAIVHFTGTVPTVKIVGFPGKFEIKAQGYRNGPAGP